MMTKQMRHYAARAQTAHPEDGLPGPGQALIGYPEPQQSLFGVPQLTASEAAWRSTPPQPRTPQDDLDRPPQRRPQPRPQRRQRPQRRSWAQLLGLPLAVLALGVALGVITVAMLVAAGFPAP